MLEYGRGKFSKQQILVKFIEAYRQLQFCVEATDPNGSQSTVPTLQASARFTPIFPPVWGALGERKMKSPGSCIIWKLKYVH